MSLTNQHFHPLSYFTFQSGSILIIKLASLIEFIKIFTFQSGSILMGELKSRLYIAMNFTFQSGSILIIIP